MEIKDLINKDNLKLSFIVDRFDQVDEQFGGIISDSLNKKWKRKDATLLDNFLAYSDEKNVPMVNVKCLIWQPSGLTRNGVAFMTNMPDGWPTLLNYYFLNFLSEIVMVTIDNVEEELPTFSFKYLRGDDQRVVRVSKEEGGWMFYQNGTALEFEDVANYKKRKISDRLNATIIKTYLERIGIYLDDERFWLPSAHSVLYSTDLIGAFG